MRAVVLWLVAAVGVAQTVPVAVNGYITVQGVPAIYNTQYVMKQTDFGFLWLDTVAMSGGQVQALSKCSPWPYSKSNIYTAGDCNGITDIETNGGSVVARVLTGNCYATEVVGSCGGAKQKPPVVYFLFGLGAGFPYLGSGTDIGQNSQKTDPEGRTWGATCGPPGPVTSCLWAVTGSGEPTATPGVTWTPSFATATPLPATATPVPSARATATAVPTSGGPCVPFFTSDGQCHCLNNPGMSCPVQPTATRSPTKTPTRTPTVFPTAPPELRTATPVPTFGPSPTATIIPRTTVVPVKTPAPPSASTTIKTTALLIVGGVLLIAVIYFVKHGTA